MKKCLKENFEVHIAYHIYHEFGRYSGIIFEKNGTFDNFKNICEFVTKKIITNKSEEIDCSEFVTFFDKLIINYQNGNGLYGSYDKYENDVVYINLCVNENDDFFELENIILHELLHAYEDYNRLSNDKHSINYYLTNAHIKAQLYLNSRDKIISHLSKCQYFLNDQERNAYFGTLENTILKIVNDNSISLSNLNYKFIVDKIFKTGIWKEYELIHNFVDNLNNLTLSEEKLFVSVYNSMNKTNKTMNQICKEFKTKWRKFDSKFNQLVPKIICDNINIDKGF